MARYRPTDGSKMTLVVPVFADRTHQIEVEAEYLASDSECGQQAGWYANDMFLLRGTQRRKVTLPRDLEDRVMATFDSLFLDMSEGE